MTRLVEYRDDMNYVSSDSVDDSKWYLSHHELIRIWVICFPTHERVISHTFQGVLDRGNNIRSSNWLVLFFSYIFVDVLEISKCLWREAKFHAS